MIYFEQFSYVLGYVAIVVAILGGVALIFQMLRWIVEDFTNKLMPAVYAMRGVKQIVDAATRLFHRWCKANKIYRLKFKMLPEFIAFMDSIEIPKQGAGDE